MAVPQRTLTLLRRLARQNGATIDAWVARIAASWVSAWAELDPAWQHAINAIVDHYQRTGAWPPAWQVARIEAVAAAQARTEQALTGLVMDACAGTRSAVAHISAATVAAEPGIIGSQRAGLEVAAPDRRGIAATLQARQARVSLLHRPLGDAAAAATRNVFTRQPVGQAPLAGVLADRVRAGFDSAFTRAVTIARTETVDTYRDSAQLVHDANQRILSAWAWHCSCDRTSCPACWVMHGRRFPLDVAGPEGHPSCRCTRLPLVADLDLPTAETRFRRLPKRDQLTILGPTRLALLRAGRIGWDDLVELRPNPNWRNSYTPRPLAALRQLAAPPAA